MIRLLKLLQDILFGLLIVAGVAYAFRDEIVPPVLPPAPPGVEVAPGKAAAFAAKVVPLPVGALGKHVQHADGKPTLMIVYASWCPYCRQLLPAVIALEKEGKLSGAHLLFVSIDKDKRALAEYVLSQGYDKIFTPYIAQPEGNRRLADVLMEKGSYYDGKIPYSLVFDGNGALLAEIPGLTSKERLIKAVGQGR